MQSFYTVTALKTGTVEVEKSAITYMSGFGERIQLPVWVAAIEGPGIRMLVDTGIRDPGRWRRQLHPCWRDSEDETIEGALAELGWRADDVDFVINTHLHFDHAENNLLFPNAQFIVSRAEWEYAMNPLPSQRQLYDYSWEDEVVTVMNYQLVAVDDLDIRPGIRIIQTPGHSKGHQSVLVTTSEDVLCIAGDAGCLLENFTLPTPPGSATSIEEGFTSLERIRSSSRRILMNHDPAIQKYQSSGFPLVPSITSAP